MYYLLAILWFIITFKAFLFYFYLWQLKEYHVARFLDHFRTEKGKRLFFNKIYLGKIVILVPFLILLSAERYLGRELFLTSILILIICIYLIESFFAFKNIFQKQFKKPVLTNKAVLLVLTGLLVELLIFALVFTKTKDIYFFAFWLLVFDVLCPFVASLIVLCIQPFVVLLRNQFILEKAKSKRESHKNLIVIGITGSYGKTSTKEFLSTILEGKFKVLKTEKHQNSEMGISQCILKNLKKEHQVFIVEMGAYGKDGIKLLSDIVKPRIGIITGINEQHLALFGSQAKIVRTKYELIEALPKNGLPPTISGKKVRGLAVFNGDNKYCLNLYKETKISKKMYKAEEKAVSELMLKPDISAKNIKMEKEYISFKVQDTDFKINVLGKQNVANILGAIIAAQELGMGLEEISKACLRIKPEQGSMKIIKEGDPNILDAAYSSNPNGVIADLEYLKLWQGKKAVIMPCLIELGEKSEEVHIEIGKKIGQVCDLAIITTKERFEEIKQGAIESGMKPKNIMYIEKPGEIIRQIGIFSAPGDVVLIEGRVSEKVIKNL